MNYHEIKQPDKNVVVNVNLAEVPKGQTIYVYTETSFKYNINVSSGTIIDKEFYLDNSPIKTTNGAIVLNPKMLEGKTSSELKIKLKLGSGTGSLAELMGEETSDIEVKFPVKYVDPKVRLTIDQRVNSDNNLEIFWKKPILEGAEVVSYSIYTYKTNTPDRILELVSIITDPNQTSYTDKDYAYGVKTFMIVTKYKSDRVPHSEDLYYVKYESLTDKMFSTSSAESFKLKIKWSNPNLFASKYVLKYQKEVIYVNSGLNEASIERPPFPVVTGSMHYQLYILPKEANFADYEKYAKVVNSFSDLKLDRQLLDLAVDAKNNIIIGKYYEREYFLQSHDRNDLSFKFKTNFLEKYPFDNLNKFQVSLETGKIAIHTRSTVGNEQRVFVYSDYTLKNLINSFSTNNATAGILFFASDDKLMLNHDLLNSGTNRVYDVNSGKLLTIFDENDGKFVPVMSYDGQYVINVRYRGSYKIYKYEKDNSLTLLKDEKETRIENVYFNPIKKNHVVIQYTDSDFSRSFSVYELPLMNKITTVKGVFGGFDKFTGNAVYLDEHYTGNAIVHVLNTAYDDRIYSIKLSSPNHDAPLLVNNYLILQELYYVNIAK